MDRDSHLIFESWKELFSGQQEDRWKELTDLQKDLINAYIDKVRSDFNDPHARQDIRLIKVVNSVTDPENLKHVHIRVPERPVHIVELDTKHDEIYVTNAHPHGNREQVKLKTNQEDSEEHDMSKSPFHYDPSHGLMQAANQINDILQSSYNDEATPEHIEKMALKILGPQAEYRDYNEFNVALKGVTALLNRYVNTEMN